MIRALQKSCGFVASQRRHPARIFQQQRYIGWVEFVEPKWDAKEKKWVSEDPEESVRRMQEEVNSKGVSLTNDPQRSPKARHTKPTTAKKELKNRVAYQRKRQQVVDLINYIQFVKDHKDKDNW